MVSIILAKSICCWQHFRLWNGLSPWGGKTCLFFFCLLFLASQNHCSRASKGAEGCQVLLSFFLSFFLFFFFLILNICYIVGGEKKWLSKLRANGEHKKKKEDGWVAVRVWTASNAKLKRKGAKGGERGSPRQKSKQRWLQERHFSATSSSLKSVTFPSLSAAVGLHGEEGRSRYPNPSPARSKLTPRRQQ